jgi:hypothetical protein
MGKRFAWLAGLAAIGIAAWLIARAAPSSDGTASDGAAVEPMIDAPTAVASPIAAPEPVAGRVDLRPPVDALPETGLPIVVLTRTALFGQGTAIPNVSVAVGAGRLGESELEPLVQATTDERGVARVSIPWSAVEALRGQTDGRLWARVVSAGFQQRTRHVQVPAEPFATEIQVLAIRGGTVLGRVLDNGGRPVAGMVRAVHAGATLASVAGAIASARSDGRFELHLDEEGKFDLVAEAEAAGTGAVLDYAVRFESPPAVVDVAVRGPGIVRGYVREASGKPAAALPLLVFLAALDDERGSFVSRDPVASAVAREGRGRSWATIETGEDGSFEARGLRADRYVVRAARARTPWEYPHLLTPSPVESDGSDLALRFERPHLAVRVVGSDGNPYPLPPASSQESADVPPESWPTTGAVFVAPVAREAILEERLRARLPVQRVGVEFVVEVEEGRRYLVGWAGSAQPWRPTEVEVPEGAGRVEVTLTLAPDAPAGEIAVSAFDAEQSMATQVAIRIDDPITGLPLVNRASFYEKPWPQTFAVPAGEYRVVVEGAPIIEFWHGRLWGPRTLGRFETLVRVVAGQTSSVTAQLPQGAKMHLVLSGNVREDDREAQRGQSFYGEDGIEYWASRATLTLVPPSGWPELPEFTFVIKGSSAAGTHLTSQLPLGSDEVSQVLPAGRFRLEARMPGGRVASKEIVLVDGATTDVALEIPD